MVVHDNFYFFVPFLPSTTYILFAFCDNQLENVALAQEQTCATTSPNRQFLNVRQT